MNEENIRKKLRSLLDEIHNKADHAALDRCRSIFREEVSFFRRSYMAAYLLMLSEGAAGDTSSESAQYVRRGRKERGIFGERKRNIAAKTHSDESKTEMPKALSEEESAQLFFSTGRNRKVYPREIFALITARAQITRDDIGIIRVLDNYSFIQVRKNVSDKVIDALNGHKFRGRTLTVNYAKSRREELSDDDEDTGHNENKE